MSGWYPDPGGEPDRYRFWDGAAWSDETSPDPGQPPPAPDPPPIRPASAHRPPAVVVVLVAALVVGAVLATWLVRGALPTDRSDESASEPPASPSPVSTAPASPCDRGQPNTRAAHPSDARVHGGNLSFPAAAEFSPARIEPRFGFAWDVTQQTAAVHADPDWVAQLAVGRFRTTDGFDGSVDRAAEEAMRCIVASSLYRPYDSTRSDRRSAPIPVDGGQGWLIESDVTVAVPGLDLAGDRVNLVVVPDGDGYGFFFSAVPIGSESLNAVADRTLRALRVS